MIFHRIERDERDHDRRPGFVFPVFRIAPIVLVLADLQPAGSAEHDIYDPGVTEDGTDPLEGAVINADPGDENAGPEDHLPEIVRAAHEAEQAGAYKAAGSLFLGLVLLEISSRLQGQACGRDDEPDDAQGIGAAVVHEAERHRGGLEDVQNGR